MLKGKMFLIFLKTTKGEQSLALGDNQFVLNSKGQQDGEFHPKVKFCLALRAEISFLLHCKFQSKL